MSRGEKHYKWFIWNEICHFAIGQRILVRKSSGQMVLTEKQLLRCQLTTFYVINQFQRKESFQQANDRFVQKCFRFFDMVFITIYSHSKWLNEINSLSVWFFSISPTHSSFILKLLYTSAFQCSSVLFKLEWLCIVL